MSEETANSVSHGVGLVASAAVMPVMILAALARHDPWQVGAAVVFGISLMLLYGASTCYHALPQCEAKRILRIIDHSAIYVLIAGTYTPFALVVFEGSLAQAILIAVWAGAAAGLVLNLLWIDAPKWVTAIVYLVLGWVGVITFPQMLSEGGVAVFVLVAVGGALYSLGAVAYATHRPNPAPGVLGYHEVFHLLVIGAAAAQYVAVSLAVL